jgi:hypothetical protein
MGRATDGLGDVVTLAASGGGGLTGTPSASPANLFAQPAGGLSLAVQVPAGTKPGLYRLSVTAKANGPSGRVVRASALIRVRAGAPSAIALRAGRAVARPDGMRGVALTARVVDSSGAAVPDGTLVSFDTPAAALQPATARPVGGVAGATLAYAPGDHPIVTASAAGAQGQLYAGRGQHRPLLRRLDRARRPAGHGRAAGRAGHGRAAGAAQPARRARPRHREPGGDDRRARRRAPCVLGGQRAGARDGDAANLGGRGAGDRQPVGRRGGAERPAAYLHERADTIEIGAYLAHIEDRLAQQLSEIVPRDRVAQQPIPIL